MIYGYTLWEKVFQYVLKELPHGSIRNIRDFNKMEKMATKKDLVFFLKFSKGNRRLMKQLMDERITLFPNPKFSLFVGDRIRHLKEIDKITSFPLLRKSYESVYEVKVVPELSEKVVMKIGDFHCGENKWLLDSGSIVPYVKHKLREESVLFEEFVPNARSIRIGIVGSPDEIQNIYIAEHINSEPAKNNPTTSWIKNIAPIEKTFLYDERYETGIRDIDAIIDETRMIAKTYHSDLLGVDWVVSEQKIGLLELNDMIGIPDDERVLKMFQDYILAVCEGYLGKRK